MIFLSILGLWIIIGLLLIISLLIIVTKIVKRKLKKKRKFMESIVNKIPQEILDEFNFAEKKLKGGMKDGITNYQANSPNKILWEIARGRKIENQCSGIGATEQTTSSRELCSESNRRESIPSGTINSDDKDSRGIRDIKPNSGRNFFARFRRR